MSFWVLTGTAGWPEQRVDRNTLAWWLLSCGGSGRAGFEVSDFRVRKFSRGVFSNLLACARWDAVIEWHCIGLSGA